MRGEVKRMVADKKYCRVIRVVLLLMLTVFVSGCNNNSDSKKINKGNLENKVISSPAKVEQTVKQESECDTTVSSGYCLSLGVLDENLVINGPDRNESEISIMGNKVVFPQGEIRAVCIGSWSRKDTAYNPEKSEIDGLIKELESAKKVRRLPKSVFKNTRIQTKVLVLNSHGEFRTVCITSYGKGYHELSVEKDDQENFSKAVVIKSDQGDKKKYIFLQSYKIEQVIKKWMMFEKNDNAFEKISKANMSVDEEDVSSWLREEELKRLKKCIKNRKETMDNPCGHDNYFKCTLQDGSIFHFSICSDGESLSTDLQVYTIDNLNSVKIANLLKSIKKRMK